jgi:hypothetical protein
VALDVVSRMSVPPDGPRYICPTTGKSRYTKGEAKSKAKSIGRLRRAKTANVHAYKCRACKGWHVGSLRPLVRP